MKKERIELVYNWENDEELSAALKLMYGKGKMLVSITGSGITPSILNIHNGEIHSSYFLTAPVYKIVMEEDYIVFDPAVQVQDYSSIK
jgi:fructose-1,6-bisphosphatase